RVRQPRPRRDRHPQLPLAAGAGRRRAPLRRARATPRQEARHHRADDHARRRCQRRTASASRRVREAIQRSVRASPDRRRHRPQPAAGGAAGFRAGRGRRQRALMPEATAVTVGASFRRVLRASGAALLAVLVSLCTVACGTVPAQRERHPSFARQPAADSPLARIVNDSIADPALTGFRLMPLGSYSLDARVQLARRAHDSLDVQYYLIKADRAGGLFMRTLRDAALRGVRVRLLVDDLYTSGSDEMFSGLAAYPNVEVRLFNPFCCARGSTLGKYAASLADFGRLNHRMHNKLFIADGSAAVMGGRNIADEYFTWRDSGNFVDMDVLVIGAAIGRLRDIFDEYWNSPQAYPVEAIVPRAGTAEEARRGFERLVDEGEQMRSITLPPNDILGYGPIAEDLDAGRLG